MNAKTVTIPRWVAILFMVGVVLDVLIGVSLGYVSLQARSASSSAHVARVAGYEACLANNDVKAADLQRWQAIITLFGPAQGNTELQRFVTGIAKANALADAPRDCGSLVP